LFKHQNGGHKAHPTVLNPVRAGIVTSPREYGWSSHARNAHGTHEPRITPHAAYLSLGADDVTRLDAYRRLFANTDAHDIDALRLHTQQQKPWGGEINLTRFSHAFDADEALCYAQSGQ
jgi:hypothetical protein